VATWEGNFTVTQPSSIPSLESTKRNIGKPNSVEILQWLLDFFGFFGQAWAPHTQVVDASEPQVLASFLEMVIFDKLGAQKCLHNF
jgi:hypothetical protein